jgi:Trk-type K+ transport system membrane component
MSTNSTSLQKPSYKIHFIYAFTIILSGIGFIIYHGWNQEQTAKCIEAAGEQQNIRWARLCKANAKSERREFINCIDKGEASNRLI